LSAAAVPLNCLNCDRQLIGPYCAFCGQAAAPRRITINTLHRDALGYLLGWEAPLFRTFWEFNYIPGRVARRYVDGRRKQYTNPLKYCLFAAGIDLLIAYYFGASTGFLGTHSAPGPLAPLVSHLRPELARSIMEVVESLVPYLGIATLLILPLLALLLLALFRKTGTNFAEYVVLCLYAQGQCYLWKCFIIFLALIGLFPPAMATPFIPPVLLLYAIVQFHPQLPRLITILQAALANLLYVTLVLSLITAVAAWRIS